MPKKKSSEPILETVQDLLIVHLATSGASGHGIRRIAGVKMNRVTRILKEIKRRNRTDGGSNG